ncbi:plasmid IncI1-type surface exclusion protein ExcA [Pseudomonas cichorii]|nr:plasmid IncI1-type surface exclusion protein ExcA [Pseudomonas cichorii]MBX8493191.1 plasmid IncI1-type surface exclusion protein ExcA [Pseudomonas cichorii]
MATVQRLKNAREGWLQVAKTAYLAIALPFLLFLGVPSLLVLPGSDPGSETHDSLILVAMFWTPIIIPMMIFIVNRRGKRKLLNKIVTSLKNKDFYSTEDGEELFQLNSGKYFGIDTRNGTILYIHRIRKGQVDVVGLTMGDWTNRELEDSTLRLYTKFSELPCIEISTPWAQRWYDTLGAMEYKRYNTPKPFTQYVSEHVESLERDNKIHIPKLA